MKNIKYIVIMMVFVFISLLLGNTCAYAHPSPFEHHHPKQDFESLPLNAEEVIGYACLHPDYYAPKFTCLHSGDTKAISGLWHILSDNNLRDYHARSLLALGYIGGEKDVVKLKNWVVNNEEFSGLLDVIDTQNISTAFVSMGLMWGRNINGAEDVLRDMVKREFWSNSKIRWWEDEESRPRLPVEETIFLVLKGSWYSGQNTLIEHSDLLTKGNERINEVASWRLGDKAFQALKHSSNNFIRFKLKDDEKAMLRSTYSGTLTEPTPRSPESIKSSNESMLKAAFIRQARIAFGEIRNAVKNEQYDKLKDRILFNRKPMDKSEIDRGWNFIQEDLKASIEAVDALKEVKFDTENIIFNTSFHIPTEPGPESDKAIKQAALKSDFVIAIPLLDSEAVAKQFPSRPLTPVDTFTEDGKLMLLLRRIDGVWYWNPFGYEAH